jgi:hypothetical protein
MVLGCPFSISFQCDIITDETITFVEGSDILTDRMNDHLLIQSSTGPGHLRFISYSNSNAVFNDTTGPVMTLKLATSDMAGHYPIRIEEAIIGNTNSQNILTETIDGNIFIPGSFINNYESNEIGLSVYPNPILDASRINLRNAQKGIYEFTLMSNSGRMIQSTFTVLRAGNNSLSLHEIINIDELPPGIYHMVVRDTNKSKSQMIKLIRMK